MTTPRRWGRVAALLLAGSLAFTACARGGNDDTGTGDPSEEAGQGLVEPGYFPQPDGGEPVRGGTLTFAEFAETRSLDPSKTIPTAASGGNSLVAVYDQIARLNPETHTFEPRLAESITPNDDYTEWTIKLRPGIKFSDGTDLNAAAVVGSMNYYFENKGFDLGLLFSIWDGVTASDDLTVVVKLKGSWATFDAMLARGIGFIAAPAAIAGGPENFRPIGAGPFVLDQYAPGEQMTFKPNPDHWDGAPYLDELRFVWLGADQTKWESFQGGSVQAGYINDSNVVDEIIEEDLPRSIFVSGNGTVVMFNHAEGNPGHYPQVRKALSLAIDPTLVTERAFGGTGMQGKTMFAPTSKWYDDTVDVNEYNPEEAKKLIEEAKAEGFDGKIHLLAPDTPAARETVLVFKAQWESVGVTVETENVRNVADFINRLFVERNYSVAQLGLQATDEAPYLNLYTSFDSKSGSNITGNNDPEMDKLLEELRTTPLDDEAAAKDVIHRIETHYQEAVPAITYRYITPTTFWNENVHGIHPLNEGMADFGKVWIKQ